MTVPTLAAPASPNCGQAVRVRPPTVGEFLQHFGGADLSTEGALWRTLKLLFTQPGELTRQYLAGRRKHGVLPLRLYPTLSLLALLIVRLVGEVTPISGTDNPALQAALRSGMVYAVHLVFALHLHAFRSVVLLALLADWLPLTVLAVAVMAVYTLVAGQRVFGGRRWARWVRGLLLSAYYFALLSAVVPLPVLASVML